MRPSEQLVLNYLQQRGASKSTDLQLALQSSQATVSRLLAALSDQLVTLGAGRATRYAIAQPVGNAGSQQPLWRVQEDGQVQRIGLLSFLARNQIHVEAKGVDLLFEPTGAQELPWFLSPLRAQGFLGRLHAEHLAAMGLSSSIEHWDTHAILVAAMHTHDAPGSLLLGDAPQGGTGATPCLPDDKTGAVLDALCADIARTLPAGSSAGGEQPKFLAVTQDGDPVLVKFSPPLGTPFGDRWSDLLHAEALSSAVLQRHGQAAAACKVITTLKRTYLLVKRFDRVGSTGRQHVAALGAVHAAFVPGPYVNWVATCEALVRQGRLPASDARAAAFMLAFGRLIGNTDMHSGNASFRVKGESLADIASGRFELTPAYDMLPMRWKPNPLVELADYTPFTPDTSLAGTQAQPAAADYWESLARLEAVSPALRAVAAAMASSG